LHRSKPKLILIIHREDADRGSTDIALTTDAAFNRAVVIRPAILTWMEEPGYRSRDRIDSR
jgi:hypothetical protein